MLTTYRIRIYGCLFYFLIWISLGFGFQRLHSFSIPEFLHFFASFLPFYLSFYSFCLLTLVTADISLTRGDTRKIWAREFILGLGILGIEIGDFFWLFYTSNFHIFMRMNSKI